MREESIYSEVRKHIADKVAQGEVVVVDWMTHEIVAKHSDISGDDTEFYRVCAYSEIKRTVSKCIGKYNAKPETDDQLVLDGFEYVQVAYTVQRNGRVELVPVDQLTDWEIESRAREYEAMAIGCRAHARELRAFARGRVQRAAE
jgi:hypothetical protein